MQTVYVVMLLACLVLIITLWRKWAQAAAEYSEERHEEYLTGRQANSAQYWQTCFGLFACILFVSAIAAYSIYLLFFQPLNP